MSTSVAGFAGSWTPTDPPRGRARHFKRLLASIGALASRRTVLGWPETKRGDAARLPTINLYNTGGLAARPRA